jgi:hypothetical protein
MEIDGRRIPHRDIVTLPPTPENIERARLIPSGKHYKIDSDSRTRGTNKYKPIYGLKDGRFYVNRHLGHWRQFIVGVRFMTEDGEPTLCFGLVLGETEMKRER